MKTFLAEVLIVGGIMVVMTGLIYDSDKIPTLATGCFIIACGIGGYPKEASK